MSRRRSSALDAIVALVALVPWWIGVGLAVLAYAILNTIASQPVPPPAPGQLGASVSRSIARGFANAGQYVLPVLCIAGAVLSWWRRRERRGLVAGVAGNPDAQALNAMSWWQFEKLVGEMFRMQGYHVAETG